MGRPSKYTPKRLATIVSALEGGKTEGTAAYEAGIHQDTMADWKARFPDFADAIAHARARYDERLLGIVRNVAEDTEHKQSPAMATWLLSKRNPKLYGNHTTIAGDPSAPLEVTGDMDRSLAKRIDELPLDEIRALIAVNVAAKVPK